MRLFEELKRRNVFRVAGVYAVVGWLLAQAAVVLETSLSLPRWFDTIVVSLLLLGFPIAMVLAWAFEMTRDGVKLTANVPAGESIAPKTGRKLDYAILGGLALVGVMIVVDRMTPEPFVTAALQPPQGEEENPLHPEERAEGPRHEGQPEEGAGAPAAKDAPQAPPAASIAVLPFADMSPGGDQEYFSDGITEEILNVLAQIDGITVASRTSAFSFRNTTQKAAEIAATLNVAYLLEGSVRRDGDKLRITAQLIDAGSDRHLWSEAFDRELSDVFAIQEEIAASIGEALRDRIGGGAGSAAPRTARTDNLAAYDKYLRARSLLKKRGDGLREAIALFKEVVAEDPGYAPAWSGLAQATEPVIFYFPEAQDPFDLATYQGLEALAARMAIDGAPHSAEALGGMADYLRDQLQWDEAEDYYRRALAEDPNDVEVIEDFQEFLHRVGRAEEALEEARRGEKIEPLWALLKDWEAIHLDALGEHAAAVALSAETAAGAPDFSGASNTAFALALKDRRWRDAARLADVAPGGRVVSRDAMRKLLAWAEHGRLAAPRDLPRFAIADWLAMLAAAEADDLVFEIFAATDPRINSMALMRVAGEKRLRCDERLKREIIRAQLPDYWRARGWPRYYRPLGETDFECA